MALFLSISFGGGSHDFGLLIQSTPLSFILWKLTTKMRNLLSTTAPHQGPGPPGFYLHSMMILVSFVPSFLSNPRLWVGIRNNNFNNDYLKVLQELLNDFLLNDEMIDYQQQNIEYGVG